MSLVDLVMPKMGESIMEATVLRWHKKPGDNVQLDENVLDIATDKVDTEVPSTTEGVLEEILFNENDVVPVGAVIARIRTAGSAQAATPPPEQQYATTPSHTAPASATAASSAPEVEAEDIPYQPAAIQINRPAQAVRFYSPLVLNIAASEGSSMSERETIPGTGNEGRVTKKDILDYVSAKKSGKSVSVPAQQNSRQPSTSPASQNDNRQNNNVPATVSYQGSAEIIEMDRMRRLIADHMVKSKATSAHVTSFAEADVTSMVLWREKIKKEFEKREGDKITFTPLFIEAVIKCLKKYNWLNSSVEGTNIVIKKDINIGMATALPTGNLIVPVIRNADQLNLVGLTRQVNYLANSARNGKLKPEETQGGTFTVTNVGTFGSIMGTPIINQPQVAILAMGVIKKRPVVIETEQGDSIAIRHIVYLSLSYDHRIIDGALGATFLSAVTKELENFDGNRDF
jgi:2-oxoglutarate dehydrogenase E2 component (dihydrolipoamide succinyltransferase)